MNQMKPYIPIVFEQNCVHSHITKQWHLQTVKVPLIFRAQITVHLCYLSKVSI